MLSKFASLSKLPKYHSANALQFSRTDASIFWRVDPIFDSLSCVRLFSLGSSISIRGESSQLMIIRQITSRIHIFISFNCAISLFSFVIFAYHTWSFCMISTFEQFLMGYFKIRLPFNPLALLLLLRYCPAIFPSVRAINRSLSTPTMTPNGIFVCVTMLQHSQSPTQMEFLYYLALEFLCDMHIYEFPIKLFFHHQQKRKMVFFQNLDRFPFQLTPSAFGSRISLSQFCQGLFGCIYTFE